MGKSTGAAGASASRRSGFSVSIEAFIEVAPDDVAAIAEAAERVKFVTDAFVENGFLVLKAESRFTAARKLPAPAAPVDRIVGHSRTKVRKAKVRKD